MTATLPDPVPLDPPHGDPAALEHLVERVAGTSFLLAVLQADLQGPAGTAPGWQGDDAAAAAVQVGVVVGLAGEVSAVLCTAAGRLSLHRDRLLEVRSRLAVLRSQQEEDYAAAWARMAALPDVVTAVRTADPAVVAVVEEVRAAEARRRREHAALLEDLTDDAVATRRVLAECSAVVGGTGRPGDTGRAVAHLALVLPGWGEAELTARGAHLAAAFGRLLTPEEREALARESIALADRPAFATALLAGMGADGVETTLFLLGDGGLRPDGPLAVLLASALGAAVRSGSAADPVGDVLDAVYVDPDDPGSESDAIALGMGAVLAVALRGRAGGPPSATVVGWGRQLVAREIAFAGDVTRGRAVDRAHGAQVDGDTADPLADVVEVLARDDDPSAAAALLGDRAVWQRLLERTWDDGGVGLAELVTRAGAAPGVAGDSAVRAGLAALGSRLEESGPDGWTVDRGTAAIVSPALAGAVAAHVDVAVDVLWPTAYDGSATDGLRGLGYLTAVPAAAATVERALVAWAATQPLTLAAGSPALPAFAVTGAYVAVEEYGQQISYVRDEYDRQAEAERRARLWNWTVGVVASLPPGPAGRVTDALQGYAAMALHLDGTWAAGVDAHQVRDRADAVALGLDALPLESVEILACAASAAAGFDGAQAALGVPEAPRSPETHWWQPALDAVTPGLGDAPEFQRNLRRRMLDDGVLPSPDR